VPKDEMVILAKRMYSVEPKPITRVNPNADFDNMVFWKKVFMQAVYETPKDYVSIFEYAKESDLGTLKFHNNLIQLKCDYSCVPKKLYIDMVKSRIPGYELPNDDDPLIYISTPDGKVYFGGLKMDTYAMPAFPIYVDHMGKACGVCGNKEKLRACSCCNCVYYCSNKCQKADWKRHKEVKEKIAQYKDTPTIIARNSTGCIVLPIL
jgi:hypothetical protein